MKILWQAIFEKLTSDSILVNLVGHSSTLPRIFLYDPDVKAVYPALVFADITSKPVFSEANTPLENTLVAFHAIDKDKEKVSDISDRLKTLIHDPSSLFFNISNSSLCNLSTLYSTRTTVFKDEFLDCYRQATMVNFYWKPTS